MKLFRIESMALAVLASACWVACSQAPQNVETEPSERSQPATEETPSSETLDPTPTPTAPMTSQDSSPSEQATVVGSYNELNAQERKVILNKGTDYPGDGGYTMTTDPGTYICRQCNSVLYRAEDKFLSHCGWPSFDDEVEGAVERVLDADGYRIEIICANCKGHLGHVFEGERLTAKNVRHCVNTTSMLFIPEGDPIPAKIVIAKQ